MLDSDGHTYTGEWRRWMRNGRGKCEYASGEIYDGNWEDNNLDGRGKMTYPSGAQYIGCYKNNLREGRGCFRDEDAIGKKAKATDEEFGRT